MRKRSRPSRFICSLLLSAFTSLASAGADLEKRLDRAAGALARFEREKASALYGDCAKEARRSGRPDLEAKALHGLWKSLWRPPRSEALLARLRGIRLRAAAAARESGNSRLEIALLLDQLREDLYRFGLKPRGQSWESRRQQLEEQARQLGDPLLINRAGGLAAYPLTDEFPWTALEMLERHAARARVLGDHAWAGNFLATAGDRRGALGDLSGAVEGYRQCARERERAEDFWRAAICRISAGSMLGNLGDAEGALQEAIEANAIARRGGWDLQEWAPEWLFHFDLARQDYRGAIAHARRYGQSEASRGLFAEGLVALEQGRPDLAASLLQKSLARIESAEQKRKASAWGKEEIELALADAYVLTGRPSFAAPYLQRLAEKPLSALLRVRLETLRAMVAETYEREEEALAHDREAIRLLEALRHRANGLDLSRFFSTRLDPLEDAIRLLLRQAEREGTSGPLFDAMRLADRAKARALLDRLSGNVFEGPPVKAPGWGMGGKSRQLVAGSNSILRARQIREAELRQAREHEESSRPGLEQLSAGDLLRELELTGGRGLAEWFFGNKRAYLFVFAHGRIAAHDLGPVEPVKMALRNHLALASSGAAPDALRRSGRALARRTGLDLLPPSVDSWIFVPDGPLSLVPLETAWFDGSFAGERYSLSYAYSMATALALERRARRSTPNTTLLAVGAGSSPQVKLPYAEREARLVSSLFDPSTPPILGSRASRKAVLEGLARRPAIFVLAAEGKSDRGRPGSARLELADGPLLASDIGKRPFANELAALVSCESGDGRVLDGEGLQGLSDAFLSAGSRVTLVSLWRVRDKDAYFFLERFYNDLSRGASPALALRQARREAIREGQSSAVWGSFVLRGAADRPLGRQGRGQGKLRLFSASLLGR